jgi:hypothetical protein
VEVEAERGHAETAELDVDVRAFGQLDDVLLPAGEDLLAPAGIRADTEQPADLVEDDRRAGKRAGEIDRVRQLRMVLPGFEAETQGCELREALANFRGCAAGAAGSGVSRISGSHRWRPM